MKILMVLLLLGLAVPVFAESKENSIPMDRLNEVSVIGRLGIPLGKVAEINASIVDGVSLGMKAYDGVYLLKVNSVDGKNIDDGPLMEFHLAPGSHVKIANDDFALYELTTGKKTGHLTGDQVKKLKESYVGKTLSLQVYELGSFSGIPDNFPKDASIWQDRGFHFRTYLRVIRELDESIK